MGGGRNWRRVTRRRQYRQVVEVAVFHRRRATKKPLGAASLGIAPKQFHSLWKTLWSVQKYLQIGAFCAIAVAGVQPLSGVEGAMLAVFGRERGGPATAWSNQVELTAASGNEVAGRLRGAQRRHVPDVVRRGRGDRARPRTPSSLAVPNNFTREWIEGHFLDLIRAAVRDASGQGAAIALTVRTRRLAAPAADRRRAGARPACTAQPEVHVRLVRHRLVEPLRARGGARGRRGAGAGVQPAVHLRRHRARQDAPAPGDRPLHRRALEPADRPLRHERDVHERLHQLAARQADRGLQAALPQLRRAADRRHPVLRAQGADPGGVLPHLQLLYEAGSQIVISSTGRRARSRRWRSGCARGSNGASSPTSSRPTSRRASPSSARR